MNKKSFAENGIFRKYKLWINISVFFAFIITIILYKKQKKPKHFFEIYNNCTIAKSLYHLASQSSLDQNAACKADWRKNE